MRGQRCREVRNLLRYSPVFRKQKWQRYRFCARMRQKFDDTTTRDDPLEHLTTEQVRRAMNAWLEAAQARLTKAERLQRAHAKQQYYQHRNAQAQRSHTKTRRARLRTLGIDADRIKSCIPPPQT